MVTTATSDLVGAHAGLRQLIAAWTLRAAIRKRPVILCYHSVGPGDRGHDPGFLRVNTERFIQHLSLLARAGGHFTSVTEIGRALAEGSGAGLVCVSFDDGYEDNHSVALPILKRYGLTATVFVTTGLLGQPSPWMSPSSGARMMNVDELRELAADGIEIGAHTVSHPDLTDLDPPACEREVVDSKTQLEALVEREVTSFAYPYFHFNDDARAIVRDAGLFGFVGLSRGSFDDPTAVPRALVTGKDGLFVLVLRVYGLYEPLVDSALGILARRLRRVVRSALAQRGSRA